MSAAAFGAALRSIAASGTRRSALGALLAALVASVDSQDGVARRYKDPRKKRRDKDEGRDKDKRKNKRKKKGKQSTSNNCKAKHSEKQILDFISKAAKKYGQSNKAMVRVARCESSLDPCALNKSGPYYGLFQFLKSTWKTTPYKDESIYDPEAQALAAAWMWKQGRKNEWACQ